MPTNTVFMGLPNPTNGGDNGTWGTELNTCITGFDALAVDNIFAVSATTTLAIFNGPVLVEATGGAGGITLTLPDATIAANKGRVYVVVKVDAAAGAITLSGTAGQTFSGLASLTIANQWSGFTIVSDGAKWVVGGITVAQGGANSVLVSNNGAPSFQTNVSITSLTLVGGLLTESAASTITAFNGGGQASATALTLEVNRVTTTVAVAPPYDSVKLMASVAGLSIIVINTTNNPIQVFGAGADTINGVAAATGVTQNPNSLEVYVCGVAGAWYVDIGVGYSGSLFTESSQDNITAHAGGGQGSATQLLAQTSRITTVATAGDSIVLPASAPGLELMVINHGANAMQVFGLGADQIDDQTNTVGVSQMPNSLVIYTCASTGKWYSEGLATGFGGPGLQTESFTNAITAFATGGQTNAVLLTSMLNRVTTVATAGDSVKLPVSAAGLYITVINSGTNSMQVFGSGTDTINGVATATGVPQMANSVCQYSCPVAGIWLAEGIGTGFNAGYPTTSYSTGLTAFATGGQTNATVLPAAINRISTVATALDSVKLPPNAPGTSIVVVNNGANTAALFPDTGAAINNLGTNNATQLPVGWTAVFNCTQANVWQMIPIPPIEKNTAITTVGAGTLTAAAIVGSVITRSGSTAAYTDTTDTAANIIAALHGATIGQGWELTIKNTVAFNQTISPGAGVTLTPNNPTVIGPNSASRWLVSYTGAGAVSMQLLAIFPLSVMLASQFTAVATAAPFTLTAAQMAGAQDVTTNLTGTSGTVTSDTGPNIIAQIPNAQVGQTYRWRAFNSGAGTTTIAANATGVTLNGTATIPATTGRDFYVTVVTATTVAIQSIGLTGTGAL